MISFLNSIILPALTAAVIPVIIHLLSRQKSRKVLFSSIRFLKLMEHQRIRQIKLYNLLLIIFRTLFIVFLVLTFSRPAFRNDIMDFNSNAAITAVVFIDDSYSMNAYSGANTRFETARNALSEVLSFFSNDDHIFVLSPSKPEPFQLPLQGSSNTYLDLYKPTYSTVDFNPAQKAAFEIFDRYPNVNQEFYLVSDFQINQLPLLDSLNTGIEKRDIRLFLIDPSSSWPFNNISIDSVAIKSQIYEIEKPLLLDIYLRNHDPDVQKNVLVHLYRDDERVAMDQVALPAGATETVQMFYVPKTTGEQFLHLELEEDDLLTDNYFYLNVTIPEKIRILVAGNRLNPAFLNAIDVLNKNSVLDITYCGFDTWQGYHFDQFNALVIEDPPGLSSATIRRLETFLETDKNILLVPGLNYDFSHYNAFFKSLIKENIYTAKRSSANETDYFSFAPLDQHNNLFRALFTEGQYRFDSPKFHMYFDINPSGKTLLALNNGDPVLSLFPTDNGDVYVLNSGFEHEWSDFSMKGFFVPFLYRLMYIAGQSGNDSMNPLIVSDDFTSRIPNQSIRSNFQLLTPAQTTIQVIPVQTPSGMQFQLTDLIYPGHYKLYQDDRLVSAFSVNVSAFELKPPYIRKAELDGTDIPLGHTVSIPDLIAEARTGFEIWPFLLGLAISMLVSEMIIIKKMEGKTRAS